MSIIQIDSLSHTYPDGTQALDTLSLSVESREIIGIAGPNGAGKTTLINHLCGYTIAQCGSVTVAGMPVKKETLDDIRRKVGIVFQNTDDQLFMPTVIEDVAFGLRTRGMPPEEARVTALHQLEELELNHLANKPPFHLSQGQKRFVAFAGIITLQPEIIIMDEPTSDLDPRHRRMTINLIKSLTTTTRLIVSHDLDFLWDTCDRIVLMNSGKSVCNGKTHDLLADKTLLEENGLELPLRFSGT